MSESKKTPGVAFWTTVAVVCLLPFAGYFTAYAWFVEPVPRESKLWITKHPKYPQLGDSPLWKTLFEPAHLTDRRVRPQLWQREPASPYIPLADALPIEVSH